MPLSHNPFDPNDPNALLAFLNDSSAPFILIDTLGVAESFAAAPTTVAAAKAGSSLTPTLYVTESGDTSAVSVTDIHQGQIGDCYLLASIGEIALTNPSFITNMIKANANGTESVTLYDASTGKLPTYGTTAFKATSETIVNVFAGNGVNNGATQDVVGNQKEIWAQVLEKADAQLSGGYGAISSGGNPTIAMEELTGKTATVVSPANLTQAMLQSDIAAKDLIVMDTTTYPKAGYGLVGAHAYMFDGLVQVNGVAEVKLLNPWGTDDPSLIPLAKLASAGIVEVDIGHTT